MEGKTLVFCAIPPSLSKAFETGGTFRFHGTLSKELAVKQSAMVATIKSIVKSGLAQKTYTRINLQGLIGKGVDMGYDLLNELFVASEGISVNQYIIEQKTELIRLMLKEQPSAFPHVAPGTETDM